ncbi:MAG: amino acid permease [Bacteroidia bacterium]|jgi:amino acid transporter|nr:amino acid permease [Bacteroidia bacterium]
MASTSLNPKGKFGIAPVFLTAISTILGAIMFLRFGYSVGQVGVYGTLGIVLLGHLVTIPTAMALAEIATNQKVEGGGEYFIISRSFGLTIGAAIGIALYLSQAISVAFYLIAFTEAFEPILPMINEYLPFAINKMAIGIISVLLLSWLMLTKGASSGMTLLYVVVGILAISLVMFFAGGPVEGFITPDAFHWNQDKNDFFFVFAIVFPAFTGMTAGVGLSGDLKDPKKSIPLGTLAATTIGMIIYIFIAFKLGNSASGADLGNIDNQLIMADIAVWWPIIPIGLAAATISSALGSIMVAPRTLNAISLDKIVPIPRLNRWLSRVKPSNNEPVNASLVTCVIAFFFVLVGDVNAVAEIISMFFMVTYGSICLISLFENFASNPGYRPSFKSKWYISLLGAVMCIVLMFKINIIYAITAVALMVIIYLVLGLYQKKGDMAAIFSGVIFQVSRNIQVFLQKRKANTDDAWRPSVVAISRDSFDRFASFDLLRWISHRIGFGTYIHHRDGYLSSESMKQAQADQLRLVKMTQISDSSVFVDTLVNPTYMGSISQALQLPGISGQENNMILFEFNKHQEDGCKEIVEHIGLAKAVDYDICVLASSDKDFGFNNEIHLWITSSDFQNANLMIYIAYIILGHPDWSKGGQIKLFSLTPEGEVDEQRMAMQDMISTGRLPISANNIEIIPKSEEVTNKEVINERSRDADLTIVGFRYEKVKHDGHQNFTGYDNIGNVLFVNARKEKELV